MAVAGDGGGGFTREYLEEGLTRLQEENEEIPNKETESAIEKIEEALAQLDQGE